MTEFSANLGFLWRDRPLPDAIRAAASCGFHAVECHWPYGVPAGEVADALRETGLPMMSLNTSPGDTAAGMRGHAACPGYERQARDDIRAAIAYAAATETRAVHVMAGNASGPDAELCFLDALRFASDVAREHGLTILIEPLNAGDAPGYFLRTTGQAAQIIENLGLDNVRMMFDCYHVALTEGDVLDRFRACRSLIGHVQAASVPDRGPLDAGRVDYRQLFSQMEWPGPIGAEYDPRGPTEQSLGWLARWR